MEIEIKKIWYLKTTSVSVIVGALGMIKKGTERNIIKICDSLSIYEIQNIVENLAQ